MPELKLKWTQGLGSTSRAKCGSFLSCSTSYHYDRKSKVGGYHARVMNSYVINTRTGKALVFPDELTAQLKAEEILSREILRAAELMKVDNGL